MSNPNPTGDLLSQLRQIMQESKYSPVPLNAYIVLSSDAHNSENPAECDKRRSFISGFTGSAGTAIITLDHACMWTDGRYFLQAAQEMDSNWILMKIGVSNTPFEGEWLVKNLPENSYVGVDPTLIPYTFFIRLQADLQTYGHDLIAVETNLIDLIWTNKALRIHNPIIPLEIKFSGKSIKDKLSDVRLQMNEKNSYILVITALDEVAWILNLRGSDVEFNPVFYGFVIIVPDSVLLLIDSSQTTLEVEQHLKSESGTEKSINKYQDGLVWCSYDANYCITNLVPSERLRIKVTPIALTKVVKNKVEAQGMKSAHIKDAVALCCYYSWLEKSITNKEKVTEISGVEKLEEFRQLQADYIGPSFSTISAFGHHAALIHYTPDTTSNAEITADRLYLCDAGSQFKEGTTDVTRTFHFGNATEYEKECYTRVLKGQLRLARAIFPYKLKGNCLDSFARQYLWDIGLDFNHGTGHGIGCYLNVHEGPIGIARWNVPDDPGFEINMFLSNEPGYYENGKFGIRIEDIVQVVAADTKHNFFSEGFLTFDTITLVPKQIKLLKKDMLTKEEIQQLNEYHQKCRDVLGPLLEQRFAEAKVWLWKETEAILNV